ncbi:hypothetical protein GJV26_22530 [Massilia dura]|uniref:DUF7684 domain-containing protein n=1 Tax=Pseudoduganella dura TaxID=321982 RepID=A0A6I3XPL1_9BURK|nr:hypothetical protein [Pseudoduganella dura]MUI15222.1 hypothetical protein [Pseudoduganella dura]GGY06843.1 hypothetical protein GCM10007386_41830 [Pseudoduganella dura]
MSKRTVQYLQLPPDGDLPSLDGEPFAAIIVIEADVAELWRCDVSRWLVSSGCRYMLAWGKDCSAWDDSVDEANMEAHAYDDIPEGEFVVTTWHDDEELSEVFWFAKHRASHPKLVLNLVIIVHIADAAREQELREAYVQA